MYTITYILGDDETYGTKIAGEHFFRIKMAFTVNDTGVDEQRFGRTYGIHVMDIGELEIGRGLSENLLAVGEYNFDLQDNGYESGGAIVYELRQLLLEGPLAKVVDKKALITVEVLYDGDYPTWTTDFTGYLTKKSLRRLSKNGSMKLTALPRTNILKNKFLRNEQGLAYNPLNYVTQEIDGHVIWGRSVVGGYLMSPKLTEFITDIFKLINPSVVVNFSHNWQFNGYNGVGTQVLSLEDLYLGYPYPTTGYGPLVSNIIGQIFGTYNDFYGMENIDDVLKKTAFIFGSVTGMETNETAIFKQINVYDSGNTQTLGLVKNIEEGFEEDDLEGIRIVSRKYMASNENKNMYKEDEPKSIVYSIPDADLRKGNIIDEEIFVEGNLSTSDYPSNLWAIYSASVYQIQSYNTPDYVGRVGRPSDVGCMAVWLAMFYWNLLNGWSTNRVDKITVQGLKYLYSKDFALNGNGYQILKMRKRYAQNETIFDALFVKDIVDATGGGSIPPRPNYNTYLPAGFLNALKYNFVVRATNANDGSVTICKALTGMRVEQIRMIWSEAFNNVTAMWVTDSEKTLKPTDETNLIWTYDEAVLEVNVWKTYTSDQDIVLHFTTSGTVSTGIVECTTEIATRS